MSNYIKYTCHRCDKEYTLKTNYTRHVNRKFPCKQSISKSSSETVKNIDNDNHSQQDELKKHYIELEELKQQYKQGIEDLKKMKTKQEKEPVHTDNVIVDDKVDNQNKLVAFGCEDLSFISDEMYKTIIRRCFNSLPRLIKDVYFNKNKPEIHNVYASSIKDNYAFTYDGENWLLGKKSEIVQQIIDDRIYDLQTKYEQFVEEKAMTDYELKEFAKFLANFEDQTNMDELKDKIKSILYNYRHPATDIRKKMEKEREKN